MNVYPIIKNPYYIDLQKTKVGLTLVYENGSESKAELVVPEGGKTGVNPIWDKILENFDEKKMRKDRNDFESKLIRDREFANKKHRATVESEKMKSLFDQKMKYFNLPFVKEATSEEKSALRRCPDILTLNIVANAIAQKYIKDNDISLLDFINKLEEENTQ